MTGISIFVAIVYTCLIGYFYYGFQNRIPLALKHNNPKQKFSVLIAFRNEEKNLLELLNSLSQLNYPTTHFELIFIDDHSEDSSKITIEKFSERNPTLNIRILSNQKNGKKAAISLGVQQASYDWILTTDADCTVQKSWLHGYDNLLQEKNYTFIAGPVAFSENKTFLHQFQNIDFLSLQGSTIASFALKKPFMSNGANNGFHKPTFRTLQGYKGNENIASGDDVFLLEKTAKQHPDKIGFLNTNAATVITKPLDSWKQLLHQRMRWAAKATASKNKFGVFVGTAIFSCNLCLGILAWTNPTYALCLFIGKGILDFLLIQQTAKFFSKKITMGSYLGSAILYPIYSVTVFLATLFFRFEWKGRRLRK